MVLCKHFQAGSCRFGSKCNNEHIDIKQLVKNDMESTINGHQWVFSCYGPFKDKPNIPNFIEDESFEEVRLLCYEARQKNLYDQFHQQFSLGVTKATNKMRELLNPNYEVLNLLIMMYDSPIAANGNSSNVTSTDASSIFGKSTIPNSTIGGNTFGGGGIFGGGGTNTNNNAVSIFGGQTNIAAQQQATIFGQGQQPQQQQGNTGSIFGGVAKPPQFGQQQTGGGAVGFGLFAQAAQQSGLFNQQNTFGQQQQQQQQLQTNSFAQNSFNMQPVQTAGGFQVVQQQQQNLFGQNAQQPTTMGSNIFSQAMQQTPEGAQTGGFFQHDAAGAFSQQCPQQQHQQTMSQQPQINQNQNTAAPTNAVYSKLSDLNPDEIEAFKADFFEPGKLPLSPPPFELLN